jgi:hypothetical protein
VTNRQNVTQNGLKVAAVRMELVAIRSFVPINAIAALIRMFGSANVAKQ